MGRFLFDWPLFIMGLLLSLCGLVFVYSATWQEMDPPGPYFSRKFIVQTIAFMLALLAFHFLRRWKWNIRPTSWIWFAYGAIMLLLGVVLIPGVSGGTANSWIVLGPVNLQPSEFAKVIFIMLLAWMYSGEAGQIQAAYFRALGILVSMVGILLLQPDLGTSMVFVFTFFLMSLAAGVKGRLLLLTMLGMFLLALPAWFFVLHDYQKNRLKIFIFHDTDPQGIGYQVNQSEIAVGSGGVWGKGFLQGTQNRGDFVPEDENDFIFTVIAEEFGLFGCSIVLLLFLLLIARVLALSRSAQSQYERMLCFGAAGVFLFQLYVSVGMTMRLSPVTGIPLPFISAGGSALIAMWVLLAILESIYLTSRRVNRPGKSLR
ncbi:rod shape-determining protein RodA [bacterium]|nr:rod shape-determining protein RodA [bacterium]